MIYLDNSATSPIAQEVFEAYGNPSSKYYPLAAHAADAVENSRSWVAKLIHAKPEEIIFTCGSTESTNMIIKGVADYKKYYEKKGNHIITSKVEHHIKYLPLFERRYLFQSGCHLFAVWQSSQSGPRL